MSRSPLVAIALLLAIWFLVPVASKYSGIWDARVHPKAGVEVQLKTGPTVRGALSREWSGDYLLQSDDGELYLFTSDGFLSMKFPMPSESERDQFFSKHWRALVLPVLLSAGVLAALALIVVGNPLARVRT